MPDREKVKKALERCLICDTSVVATPEAQKAYLECEYTVGRYCGQKRVLRDALALLKEREPVKPTWRQGKAYCGQCGQKIPRKCDGIERRYCSFCGQAVKW